MKPRLRLHAGVWSCASYSPASIGIVWRIGYGYSPMAAFQDWEAQG